MSFCTAVACIDGRVQLPVIAYLKKRFNVEYVDIVTEPGPNLILGELTNYSAMESIFERINISVKYHGSVGIAVMGHHDCYGNPGDKDKQIINIQASVRRIRLRYKDVPVIGLWVNEKWEVSEVEEETMSS
jgi:hypothetical protein